MQRKAGVCNCSLKAQACKLTFGIHLLFLAVHEKGQNREVFVLLSQY